MSLVSPSQHTLIEFLEERSRLRDRNDSLLHRLLDAEVKVKELEKRVKDFHGDLKKYMVDRHFPKMLDKGRADK